MMIRCVPMLLIGIFASTASGRLIPGWPYERLFKEADLVVIAVPVSEKKTNDRFGEPQEEHLQLKVEGVQTKFEVRHILKGKADGKHIKMLHFQFAKPEKNEIVVIEDGPMFVAIRLKGLTVQENKDTLYLPPPEYLLFLRRQKDGRYEPVSGRYDPEFAVREVAKPLDDTFGKRR
ncbi:hypothetical protein [Zavarzinella formosa]|uniref:hypothetical protein n=1 Tax=Zavarzinella formosa TaxID=360055 RepID=UPI000381F21D|nr:hypothetical protein [Zavarzinella formosa]